MREIKLRAWNIDRKEYLYIDLQSMEDLEIYANALDYNIYELEQYTGLKDKNGKEIYEGDIVNRYGGGLLGDPKKIINAGVVEFCDGGFYIKKTGYLHNSDSEIEVIGNIHDHRTTQSQNRKLEDGGAEASRV